MAPLRSCLLFLLVLTATGAACGRAGGTLTELQRVRAGTLDVVLLSTSEGLRHGKDAFTIEFRSVVDASLVDVGAVRGSATMPMPGMPMFGTIEVKRTSVPGRYAADAVLEMAGTWRMTLAWEGPAGSGSISFSGTAL